MNEEVTCAVCGKSFQKASGHAQFYQGQTIYTCGAVCRDRFTKNPRRFKEVARPSQTPQKAQPSPPPSGQTTQTTPAKPKGA